MHPGITHSQKFIYFEYFRAATVYLLCIFPGIPVPKIVSLYNVKLCGGDGGGNPKKC